MPFSTRWRELVRFLFRPISNIEIAVLMGMALAAIVYLAFARVTVRNASAESLTSVEVSGRGFVRRLDSLPAFSSHTFWFVPEGDTAVRVSFRVDEHQYDGGAHGYYTAPPRPQMSGTLTIDAALHAHFGFDELPFLTLP
jgi:hypothetical protein